MTRKYNLMEEWLSYNKYSRSGKSMGELLGIAIHWVGNPNTSAYNNRNYFNKLKGTYASAHEIIDLDGDIVLCIPENEVAYHVGSRAYTERCLQELGRYPNYHLYGIEGCHLDWDGRMTEETYDTLVARVADLCTEWGFDPFKNLWLHWEVVGWKDCHRGFVKGIYDWEKFKKEVANAMADIKLEEWQRNLGMDAIKNLSDGVGIDLLQNPRYWEDKLAESMPNWLAFTLFSRLANRIEEEIGGK